LICLPSANLSILQSSFLRRLVQLRGWHTCNQAFTLLLILYLLHAIYYLKLDKRTKSSITHVCSESIVILHDIWLKWVLRRKAIYTFEVLVRVDLNFLSPLRKSKSQNYCFKLHIYTLKDMLLKICSQNYSCGSSLHMFLYVLKIRMIYFSFLHVDIYTDLTHSI
jgi:hypothetical protein